MAGSSGGRCARSTSTFSFVRIIGIASSSAASIPRPSRSTLTIPMSAQSSLSHWTTTRPGIDAGSSGTTSSSRPAAMTMPPECWPRWRGPVLHLQPEPHEVAGASVARVEARRGDFLLELLDGLPELPEVPARELLREPVHLFGGVAERLPHLARRHPVAVRDDVRRHPRAARAIFLVDVLDDFLALVAGGEVEVDVGPLAPLLREEALEEELHLHRVDRRDRERVTDRAVRGGARGPAPGSSARRRTARCPRRSGNSRRGRASRSGRAPSRSAPARAR